VRKRELLIIVFLLIAGFIAWELLPGAGTVDPEESANLAEMPGPEAAPAAGPGDAQMMAIAPAALAADFPIDFPANAGLLAIAGNPGETFYTVNEGGRAAVVNRLADGSDEILWSTESDQILEIVGSVGAELLLKFIDEPFTRPADGWRRGGFYGLDMFAPWVGVYPSNLKPEDVDAIREILER